MHTIEKYYLKNTKNKIKVYIVTDVGYPFEHSSINTNFRIKGLNISNKIIEVLAKGLEDEKFMLLHKENNR